MSILNNKSSKSTYNSLIYIEKLTNSIFIPSYLSIYIWFFNLFSKNIEKNIRVGEKLREKERFKRPRTNQTTKEFHIYCPILEISSIKERKRTIQKTKN